MFFSQYTFMGVDPNNLTDDHGIDYAEQTKNHTLINRAYSIDNPKRKYERLRRESVGLTAGDSVKGLFRSFARGRQGGHTADRGFVVDAVHAFVFDAGSPLFL